ncbi:MAG: hypothetical protein BWX72_01094 [Firmicutes bacterium ADurb.Bin080]|jgi:predicted DNA-binding transcriptional regulator YafY|nr:WYL domain-containing protein [Clostridiales bacterium]OQC15094.1 MAG: hypothetical protein BWX72_01094 [Firmicutes bacterium ADurb.Bin080]
MEISQKVKLLKILEILTFNTDEDHPLTTKEILIKLNDMGIKCDRKTLYNDIEVLNANGYEILVERKNYNEYKIVDRTFEVPEIRILIDAVTSANFISQKKTDLLIKKMGLLVGSPKHSELKSSYNWVNHSKTTNECVYYSIDYIDRAIHDNKKVSFQYFDIDISGKRVFRKSGERYFLNPLALVVNESKYYLIGFSDKYKDTSIFRVDKMDRVEIESEDRTDISCLKDYDLEKMMTETIRMFTGDKKKVHLICENSPDIIVQLKDQFGDSISMFEMPNNKFSAHFEARISPTFYSWVFTYQDKIKIVAPAEVVEEYKKQLNKSLSQY